MKISKPKFLINIFIALLSFQIYFGAIFGYFFAKFLSKRIRSLCFEFKNWKFHFHHWLMGFGILILAFIFNFIPLPQFFFGFFGGIAFQGIHCYPDWYRILFRKRD